MKPQSAQRGLTLVEVLVALALWGLIAALMTRGLDVIDRSQRQQTQANQAHALLQSTLAQWAADLNQLDRLTTQPVTIDWNGRVLRLLRYSPAPDNGSRLVVAWGLQNGRWVRWQSAPLQTRAEWRTAWDAALIALETERTTDPTVAGEWLAATGWRIFFFRNDSWSNALSSSGTAESSVPDGIRLQLDLSPQGTGQGQLQWDWVRPTWSVNRS
jgi:general secretion pathway protein J